jgi:hypothetical protein
MSMTEREHWKLINSNDYRVWSVAKHRSAEALAEMTEDSTGLADKFWKLYQDTGDYYYASLSKKLKS